MLNTRRPRRNRKSQSIREMVQETFLRTSDLVYPLFIVNGVNKKIAIDAMPEISRFSIDNMLKEVEESMNLGIKNFILFPAVEEHLKDSHATYSYSNQNFYLKAISEIKKNFPEATVITDIAMDPYSSDGHDGLVHEGEIQNDPTLPILAKMALAQAHAGADILGPSDMMDGRIAYIRKALDEQKFTNVSIMAYTAKYASAFYGPFRVALDSAPKAGDKKTYQMNPANQKEALIEAELDTEEGADFLMVKPALPYLDVIKTLKDNSHLPIAAYNVSGEYSMLMHAVGKGLLSEDAIDEALLSIKRAGADIIITYFAKKIAAKLV